MAIKPEECDGLSPGDRNFVDVLEKQIDEQLCIHYKVGGAPTEIRLGQRIPELIQGALKARYSADWSVDFEDQGPSGTFMIFRAVPSVEQGTQKEAADGDQS